MKSRFGCCCGSIDGPTLLKKEILMACITNSKIILEQNFQKREYLMGPTFPKKEKIFMVHISDPKINLEFSSKNEILMGPTFPKLDNTTKQVMFTVC